MEIFIAFLVSVGINLVMFIPAFSLKTDKLTDISYAVTFMFVSLYSLAISATTFPAVLLIFMIFVWASRLGIYLFIRIRKIGKDKRFDEMRQSFWKFFRFWLIQGVTVWIVLLPSILFLRNEIENISYYAYLGVAIWFVGLLTETIADLQKYRFINNPDNKGQWINSGFWKYSRHPNYFGEILFWLGIYLFVIFGLTPLQALIGFLGPLYIALLIIFLSGIPTLEKAADARWGNNNAYVSYKKKTSILIPWLNKTQS